MTFDLWKAQAPSRRAWKEAAPLQSEFAGTQSESQEPELHMGSGHVISVITHEPTPRESRTVNDVLT